ncbi:MAG: hypothetical protein ACE5IC_04960 [Candidatus Brocadiales bacterium]
MNAPTLKVFAILTAFCLSFLLFSQAVTLGGQETDLKEQMQKKLDNMGELLTGLALEDWSRIEKAAQGLVETCEALGWTGPGKEEFGKRDAAFHSAAQALLKHAKKKNLADTQRAFVHATITCWGCHDLPTAK